jgi:single stranded DNA-binding protein
VAFTLNSVNLIGNVARDLTESDIRDVTPAGREQTKVLTFPLMVSGAGNDREKPGSFYVTCWGRAAEAAYNALHKGSKVAVAGSLRQSSWTPEGSDKTEYRVGIANATVIFLDPRNGNGQTPSPSSSEEPPVGDPPAQAFPDDGIPF